MPPPMSPQGSRAGLITAVVVLSILFVTSAIFAFYYNAEFRGKERDSDTLTKTNQLLASNDVQASPDYAALTELRTSDPKFKDQSLVEILQTQRNEANMALAGVPDPAAADAKYRRALAAARDKAVAEAGIKVPPGSSAADAVDQLAKAVREQAGENQSLSEQLAAAQQQFEKEVSQRKVVLAERDEKTTEQGKELAEALAQIAARGEAGDQSVAKIQREADRALGVAQKAASAQRKLVAAGNETIAKQAREIELLTQRLKKIRIDPKEPIVRQADGEIVRVPGNDNVYINLGKGDQISPGLTFEVYDRFAGVPALGDGADEEGVLPQGKASIEVARVGANQSECRIVRLTPGQSVIERDVIANLVYDKKVKNSFVVFGDFDLDQNRIPTPGDADVIKRLITGWGGRLQDEVNVNTDFVVLGVEPEVPASDEGDSASDIKRRDDQQKALDAYLEVRSAATKLNIPILNQNRFLYFVGYYERSQR